MSVKRIRKINPVQAGKVAAVVAILLILIIFVPFMLLFSLFGLTSSDTGLGFAFGGSILVLVIFMPIVYGIIAFLFGMFHAFIYNVTYRFHGGMEIEYDDMDDEINRIGS